MRIPLQILVLFPLAALACGRAKPAAQAGGQVESTSFAPELSVDLSSSTRTQSGLYYRDLVVGSGPELAAGAQVSVHYTGWLPDGTRFDGNENGPAFVFRLGAHEVIDGWDQGVTGMRVGGKRQLIIPAELGYRASGSGPIPPNAVLVFQVEVNSAAP